MASVDPQPDTEQQNPTSTGTNGNSKLKRFRFIDSYDLTLLKAVRCVDAHIPEWGKAEALYEEVLKLFLRDVPCAVFVHSQKPSGKTLSDRFKRLIARWREDVKKTSAASGISETHGENELLLDDLILEMDEKEEATRVEKELQSKKERELVAAGENIRERALKRRNNDADDVQGDGSSTRSSAKKTRARRNEVVHSDDEVTAALISQGEIKQEMEKSRLELMKSQMALEERKAEKEEERFEKIQNDTRRRLDLDEKRFELEKEERKQSLVEREKMINVMELLCKKLE